MTGLTSGPHLYFEMILAGKPVDPAPYLKVAQCDGSVRPVAPVRPDDGSVMIDGRKYWQFSLPARQYIPVAPELGLGRTGELALSRRPSAGTAAHAALSLQRRDIVYF